MSTLSETAWTEAEAMKVWQLHYSPPLDSVHPDEDYSLVHGGCFVVCDGVTLLHYNPYPNPSPALEASKRAAVAAADYYRSHQSEGEGISLLKAMFKAANQAIAAYNQTIGITPASVNYLTKQYAACTMAYGFIKNGTLFAAHVQDTEVLVTDPQGKLAWSLEVDDLNLGRYIKYLETLPKLSNAEAVHQYVRKEVVNNAKLEFGTQPVRLGNINGDPRAAEFLETGWHQLKADETILFYTDGMWPYLKDRAFRAQIATANSQAEAATLIEKLAPTDVKLQKERTLIIIKP